jgi:hypothetical protein
VQKTIQGYHDDEIEFGSGGEQMARYVHVGGNVVVKCQSSMGENY